MADNNLSQRHFDSVHERIASLPQQEERAENVNINRYSLDLEPVQTPDGLRWKCELRELPGSVAFGTDEGSAMEQARKNGRLLIQHAERNGMPFPLPGDELPDPSTIKVQVHPLLHHRLDLLSHLQNVSFNETVVQILEDELASMRFDGVVQYVASSPRSLRLVRLAYANFDALINVDPLTLDPKAKNWVQRVPAELHWRLWAQSRYVGRPMSKTISSMLERAMTRLEDQLRQMKTHWQFSQEPPGASVPIAMPDRVRRRPGGGSRKRPASSD